MLLSVERIVKSYNEKILINDVSLYIDKRVGQFLETDSGSVVLGDTLKLGYLSP